VSLCTDDVHAKDLLEKGHLNWVVKRAIDAGVDPLDAYRAATLNGAREYGFEDLGAIAPFYLADMQLLKNLDGGRPEAVFIEGKLVAREGVYLGEDAPGAGAGAGEGEKNTVNVTAVTSPADFTLTEAAAPGGKMRCLVPRGQGRRGYTNEWRTFPVDENGNITLTDDCCFVSVVNRYGLARKAAAVIAGFGLTAGAFASTISHDSHNLTVVYKDPADAFAAVEELCRTGGGVTICAGGRPVATLKLPVGGLMSALPCEALAREVGRVEAAARHYGVSRILATSSLSLPVAPGTVITDGGLVDGISQRFL